MNGYNVEDLTTRFLTPSFNNNYIDGNKPTSNEPLEIQLIQLLRITSDGDVVSKLLRDQLVDKGFAARYEGFNIITTEGIKYLNAKKIIVYD